VLHDLALAIPNRSLTTEEIRSVTVDLLNPSVSDESKTTFLSTWAKRGETAAELADCAEAFLPQAVDPGIRGTWKDRALLDCCGTGGGGLNLINISTGLMFILSALDIPVVKHGNRGITKKSGSADVLEALEIKIDLAPEQIPHCLEEVGCAFLFAPFYHPAFAVIASARRTLAAQGQRTIFNLLGPLLNPARPDARLVGVFKPEHVVFYREALKKMGCPHFSIVYGKDQASDTALGEASAHGATRIGRRSQDELITQNIPQPQPLETLFVKNTEESAKRLTAILSGNETGLGREMLLINAAVAAQTHDPKISLEEGLARSKEALDSGRAHEVLKRWQKFSDRS